MAAPTELDREAVLRFLAERGGRARNAELLEHFRAFLDSPEPQRRARARQGFKELVNAVATVKQEPGSGAKYVQLRKKYRSNAANGPQTLEKAEAEKEVSPAKETPGGSNRRSGAGQEEDAAAAAATNSEPDSLTEGKPGAASGQPPPCEERAPSQGQPEGPGGGGGREGRQPEAREEEGGCPRPSPGAEGEELAATPAEEEAAAAMSPCSPPSASLSLLTSTAATPRAGRKHLRERVLLGSSPQMKRGGDWDSASVASSSAEEEGGGSGGGSGALEPLEHAWMLCASEGRWESLEGLLSCEPALLCKRDFITGFSCLHWAAKHGRPELLALLVNFARRHRLPVSVNARTSSGGYTALHLAAMHGHLEVVKLLVGAYDADVELRDYSGRKAAHYLGPGASGEVRSLVGALQDDEADGGAPNGSGRWRLSKVLPSHLLASRLSAHLHQAEEGEPAEGAPGKGRELSRKSSAGSGRLKPRLNKIRFRTQIIHTTPSFRGEAEEEGQEERALKGSFKLRPKSNVFG